MGALRLRLPESGMALPLRMGAVTTKDAGKINQELTRGVEYLRKASTALRDAELSFEEASEKAKQVDNKNAEDFAWDAAGEMANTQQELGRFVQQVEDGIRYIKERRLGPHSGFTHRKA